MKDVEVFFIANLNIVDKETYRLYEKGFFPILKKHGGEFVTYDDSIEHLEGDTPLKGRVVIFKFPSEEVAKGCITIPNIRSCLNTEGKELP